MAPDCRSRWPLCGCLLPPLGCALLSLVGILVPGPLYTAQGVLWAAAVRDRFASKLRAGRPPVAIFVGTNDMSEDIGSEARFYSRHSARLVLVEANPRMIPPLRSQLRAMGIDEAKVLIVNAALTKGTSGDVTFYCVDPRLHDDLPEPLRNAVWERWTRIISRGCSLSYELGYRGLVGQPGIEPFYPHLKPMESYVTAEPVRGMTPGELLAHAGIGPADVDVLSIDAEGVSVELLNEFLLLDGLAPAAFSVEHVFEAVAGPGWDRFWGLWGPDSYSILGRWTSVDIAVVRRPSAWSLARTAISHCGELVAEGWPW